MRSGICSLLFRSLLPKDLALVKCLPDYGSNRKDKANMEESIAYYYEDFSKSLESSFIKADPDSNPRYSPRILTNNKASGTDVLSAVKRELAQCSSFDFSVAFITAGGIQVLVEMLSNLERRGIPGRILTSTYLNFNDPEALRKLTQYKNVEIRVFQGDLHAKGYFFDRDGLSTMIIGSSNLTQTALTCNKEWNILFRSFTSGGLYLEAKEQFDEVWNDPLTTAVTENWIVQYEAHRLSTGSGVPQSIRESFKADDTEVAAHTETGEIIKPNTMQTHALEALEVLHAREEKRALLISATGTGKTYLSAFDVLVTKPKRVLFVAHRERILEASQESFQRVLGSEYSYEIYGGGSSVPTSSCVFAMINTLSKHLEEFKPDEFDYIIIDEAHRTGASSYRKILDYFTPKFFLGMTATPNRTDGYDVYSLFNHVIAFRITLNDALENNMLAPFHYFGIADLEIDDETIDDFGMFSKLTSEERVRHITSKIEEYTVDKQNRKGLIFCNRNEEAARLSEMFNELGYRTAAISGQTNNEGRNEAIARLEAGELEYLFSVDILNEGVDIPAVNQIIMLRRTESAVVFVQQLGRGLRKLDDKEYTLVLDFIGNYQQNYLVPIALSNDRSYNKDTLRRFVKEGNAEIPGCSTITFDAISERRIFKALEQGKFSEARLIRNEYTHLKNLLGRIPGLLEFDENESIDPLIIFKKYGSYAAFLEKYEPDCGHSFNKRKLDALKFLSQKLATGKRRADLELLRQLVVFCKPVSEKEGIALTQASKARLASAANVLSGSYSTAGVPIVLFDGSSFKLDEQFEADLSDPDFFDCVIDTIDFGLRRNELSYGETYKDTDFVLNAKYTREEVCRLLRWEKEPNYQNIGGYFHDKETNTFPVFINYEKDASAISATTMYEDRFISDHELVAISKSKRTLQSPEIVNLAHASENGMRCFLFVRKNKEDKDDGTEFYFLGEMHPTGKFEQFVMKGTTAKAVEITYLLEDPVRADLYEYFLSDLDV